MKSAIIILFTMAIFTSSDPFEKVESAVYSWDKFEVKKQETRETRNILEGSTTHLEYFEIHATTLDAQKMPHSKHTHDTDEELVLVRTGKLKIISEDGEKIIGPGGMAFMMPGEEHGLENAGSTPAIYYILKFRSKAPMDLERGKSAGGSMVIDRSDLEFRTHDKGGRWDYFDRATTSCPDFEMHATRLNAKVNSHEPHTHSQEEIILMLKGTAKMSIDGKEYNTTAGDVIFLDSEIPHGITNTGDEACEYFAFQWK